MANESTVAANLDEAAGDGQEVVANAQVHLETRKKTPKHTVALPDLEQSKPVVINYTFPNLADYRRRVLLAMGRNSMPGRLVIGHAALTVRAAGKCRTAASRRLMWPARSGCSR
jgi:hypothetical protein